MWRGPDIKATAIILRQHSSANFAKGNAGCEQHGEGHQRDENRTGQSAQDSRHNDGNLDAQGIDSLSSAHVLLQFLPRQQNLWVRSG